MLIIKKKTCIRYTNYNQVSCIVWAVEH